MIDVSLIIPAYNIEDYIERCLKSIIKQTFKNIEVIVVDDGSTDKTLEKIEKLAKVDNRIKIISTNNNGPIEARKLGFNYSIGKFILFIDGDDWLENDAIEKLINVNKNREYDIVCYKFMFVYDDGRVIKRDQLSFDTLRGDDFLKIMLLNRIYPSVVNKLIRREFIINNNIKFPDNVGYAEDLAFITYLSMKKPKACMIDEYLYNYYQRETSITKTINSKLLDVTDATRFIEKKLIENKLLDKYKDEFEIMAYIHNYRNFRNIMIDTKCEIGSKLYSNWKSLNINIYKNSYYKEVTKEEYWKTKIVFKVFDYNYKFGKLYNYISK